MDKHAFTVQMLATNTRMSRFFDLFVAMCNHVDDIIEVTNKSSPKTI